MGVTRGVAARTVAHPRAHRQTDGLHHAQGLHNPNQQFVLAFGHHFEVLGGVDNLALVRLGGKELQRGGDILESHAHVGAPMIAGTRPNVAILELDEPIDASVHEPDRNDQIALLQAFTIGGKPACRQLKELGQRKKNGLEDLSFHIRSKKNLLHKRRHERLSGKLA
jgi:hypothetical protein